MYSPIMIATDLLLFAFICVLPAAIFLYAGYKQRPRLVYIFAYTLGIVAVVYRINNPPKAPNTNVGSQYGTLHFPFWVDVSILATVTILPLATAFLLARYVGKKRGVIASSATLSKPDIWRLGVGALIAAAFFPLVGLRDRLEQSLPNQTYYFDMETRLTPNPPDN